MNKIIEYLKDIFKFKKLLEIDMIPAPIDLDKSIPVELPEPSMTGRGKQMETYEIAKRLAKKRVLINSENIDLPLGRSSSDYHFSSQVVLHSISSTIVLDRPEWAKLLAPRTGKEWIKKHEDFGLEKVLGMPQEGDFAIYYEGNSVDGGGHGGWRYKIGWFVSHDHKNVFVLAPDKGGVFRHQSINFTCTNFFRIA